MKGFIKITNINCKIRSKIKAMIWILRINKLKQVFYKYTENTMKRIDLRLIK